MGPQWLWVVVALLAWTRGQSRPDRFQKRADPDRDVESLGVRLIGGERMSEGRVEILRHGGEWGTICDDSWESRDAQVVCRMMGYSGGQALESAFFGQGTGPILLDDVECLGDETSLAQCEHSGWQDHDCSHGEDAGVRCSEGDETSSHSPTGNPPIVSPSPLPEGEQTVRLVGGNGVEGRVEILYNEAWGTVCDDHWDYLDAEVVCRQLGHWGGVALTNAEFGEGSGQIWLDSVDCSGDEETLEDCPHDTWGDHDCSHGEDAGVRCNAPEPMTDIEVRLEGGSGEHEGRVEIFYQNAWGTVCDDSWDAKDAEVVCRQLGFSGGIALDDNEFGEGIGTIWLDDVECSGHESSIADCRHRPAGQHDCSHYEDAGVICDTTEIPEPSADIRLVGGSTSNEGRVEVFYKNQWGTVCDDFWDEQDARVVCRQLGLSGGQALDDNEFGSGSGTIWLDTVQCSGSEQALADCSHDPWGEHDCSHSEDAGVICDDDTTGTGEGGPFNNEVRLIGGSGPHEGRVEVYHDSEWGTVCDDLWDAADARVVCKQLGFHGGQALEDNEFGSGSGTIWLDSVECSGQESALEDCDHAPWGQHDCSHYEDAGVICETGSPGESTSGKDSIRLVGGSGKHEGRVEIFHAGRWGTVCDDLWNSPDAEVVCRQLGLTGGVALEDNEFGQGEGDIWLDSVACTGGESRLEECAHDSWGEHDCSHSEDAGVICDPADSGNGPVDSSTVRLRGSDSSAAGRVEVYHEGQWGTVCDDAWDEQDAQVVCKQLGMHGGIALEDEEFGAGSGNIWLDEVSCRGTESRLEDCGHASWGQHDCSHSEDAGVICISGDEPRPEPADDVRLRDGDFASMGRLEIRHDGEWGTVCDDGFGPRDALVACRMLGYDFGVSRDSFAGGSGPILLDQVECVGTESSLDDCAHDPWGQHDCSHSEDVGVVCFN